jgi:transcriptional regulatory protein LevR
MIDDMPLGVVKSRIQGTVPNKAQKATWLLGLLLLVYYGYLAMINRDLGELVMGML